MAATSGEVAALIELTTRALRNTALGTSATGK
jgi:hypothetical protein